MTLVDDLELRRAALQMINPAPYNAEAPPEALAGEITPTALHYVRSNFAVPEHDGVLDVGGAVERPLHADPRRPPRAAEGRAGGHPRVRRQRASRDEAAAHGRAVGRLRGLHRALGRRAPARRPGAGASGRRTASTSGSKAPITARTTSVRSSPETSRDDLTFVRALPLALAADPGAEILIAYEMNGEPLGPDHGAPFRIVVPHWYAVASVKWLKRIDVLTEPYTGEFQTGHYMYEWADRAPESVDLMRVRARITDPAAGVGHRRRHLHRARQGVVGNRTGDAGRGQPHRRGRVARGAAPAARRPLPLAGLVVRLGRHPTWDGTPSAPGRPTRPETSNRRSRPGTGSATGTTPSR